MRVRVKPMGLLVIVVLLAGTGAVVARSRKSAGATGLYNPSAVGLFGNKAPAGGTGEALPALVQADHQIMRRFPTGRGFDRMLLFAPTEEDASLSFGQEGAASVARINLTSTNPASGWRTHLTHPLSGPLSPAAIVHLRFRARASTPGTVYVALEDAKFKQSLPLTTAWQTCAYDIPMTRAFPGTTGPAIHLHLGTLPGTVELTDYVVAIEDKGK